MAKDNLLIENNNPYATGYIINLEDSRQLLKRNKYVYKYAVSRDRSHIVLDGETIWDIAFTKYKNSKLWFIIADANEIYNPFELTIGQELLIPDLDKIKLQLI